MLNRVGQYRRDIKLWWKRLEGKDRLELTFQGSIVFLTLGFLLFAKWQLDEIRDSSKDTKAIAEAAKQQATNTKTLAEAAKDQAQAALQQATAAKTQADASLALAKSADISAKAAQTGIEVSKSGIAIANRAYVSVDKMRFQKSLEPDQPVLLIFEFVNDGNSSAEVNGAGTHFLSSQLRECRYGDQVFSKIMVSPKSPRTQLIEISRKGFSQSEFDDIQQARRYLQICIRITYTTLDKQYPYETCSYYVPEIKTFLVCKKR